ncbi:hypothetical protein AB0J83_30990 [Actinoplanes sp. NPDC049596]|uniref:hypothetical protein n=1 Tax=unclassified Actinoplanes TaxID=2626549 RepID=UPI003427652C
MGASPFSAGSTVVRRDVLRGQVWTASPYRVVRNDDAGLMLACWPGAESWVPATWAQWMLTREDQARKAGIPNMASGEWALSRWAWQDNLMLAWYGLDPDFSLRLYRPIAGGPVQWGVDFERPVHETRIGFDTFDLLLDITLDQDLTWKWKDSDEYEQARRLGVITDADHQRVERARDRAVAFVETRGGPLATDWSSWEIPTDWTLPVLPDDALTQPVNEP